jgi:ATPase subunit of ABC transporter with duplicated ATPase domains
VSRFAIIGNAGGGKSTLARVLARQRRLRHVEIDELLWQEGWKLSSADVYLKQHADLIAGDSWVIDGLGQQASIPDDYFTEIGWRRRRLETSTTRSSLRGYSARQTPCNLSVPHVVGLASVSALANRPRKDESVPTRSYGDRPPALRRRGEFLQ